VEAAVHGSGGARIPFPEAALLSVLSAAYAVGVRLHETLYRRGVLPTRRLPCAVISVGNLTVGGTGKTPMTLWLARRVQDMGYATAVLSRGYGGRSGRAAAVAGDGRRLLLTAEEAGDEPCMMANRLQGSPVIVGRDRYAGGRLAVEAFGARVVILDDGFQHRPLARDLEIVLLDGSSPMGNGRLLPRGPLREPPSALERAHAVVFTRSAPSGPVEAGVGRYLAPGTARFVAGHRPAVYRFLPGGGRCLPNGLVPADAAFLRGKRVLAFSGIADNRDFFRTLTGLGCDVARRRGFPDHHPYSDGELRDLQGAARAAGCPVLVTTEKDFARIAHRIDGSLDTVAVGVETHFHGNSDAFRRWIRKRLERAMPPEGRGAATGEGP
jgi:tetraacyldisaccharide 4'-kinase